MTPGPELNRGISGAPPMQQPGATSTDNRGQFRFANLPPGTYYVAAEKHGVAGATVAAYRTTFSPAATEFSSATKFELSAGARVTADIRVSGTCSPANRHVLARGGSVSAAAIVTADGTFVLQNLRPAHLRVDVTSRQFAPVKIESILLGTGDVSASFDYPLDNHASLTIRTACPNEGSSR